MRIVKTLLVGLCLITPGLGFAASCLEVVNTVYADTKHFSMFISNQHLPWMNLSWLKKNLGIPQTQVMSNNKTKYVWHCENDSYLIAYTDGTGTLTKVSGRYSSDEGSGEFYSFLQSNTRP